MSALAAWWANPVTAVLLAMATAALAFILLCGLLAVIRLGSIQFAGLLSARKDLLPGVPRSLDASATTVMVWIVIMGVLVVALSGMIWRAFALLGLSGDTTWVASLVAWLLLGALANRATGGGRAEGLAALGLRLIRPLAPAIALLAKSVEHQESKRINHGQEEGDTVDEHEVKAFIGAGEEAGILEHEEAELVASIVEFSETVAREIMTPRTDLVTLPVEAPFATVTRVFAESMYTRLPVFRQTLDHIEGVVHVKDVLKAWAEGTEPSAKELMRPVLMVPETKPLRDLLRQFQSSRQQLAVVLDEYGGTAGIVTLEDVLEEIVGEIQDEHQQEQPEVQAEPDGAYIIAGNAHVDTLTELFGLELEDDAAYDSVAGLVLDRLGHLARPGEKVLYRGLSFEVLEVERRRVKRLRVRSQSEHSPV